MLLNGNNVTKNFGGLKALDDVSFALEKGEILGLIGPNGAGKTTLFNIISGFYGATLGTIKFQETEINKLKPHQICKLGIGRSFQITNPFLDLTVLENVTVGARFGRGKNTSLKEASDIALQYLEFVNLHSKKYVLAKTLNIVERKLLEIAAQKRVCIMCMEPNPKYCHRRFISAHLEKKGFKLIHITSKGQTSLLTF